MDLQKRKSPKQPDWSHVAGGQRIYPTHTWEKLAGTLHLSPRELQITKAVFDDHNEVAIAVRLDISVHTVHTHLRRLYQKLGVRSRIGLVLCIVSIERDMNGQASSSPAASSDRPLDCSHHSQIPRP